MRYQSYSPSPGLRPFVERYCLLEQNEQVAHPDLMPPGGFSGLMLNLGDDYHARTPTGLLSLPRCGLGGQLTRTMHLSAPARTRVLLIMFRPTGLHRAFGLPMPTVTNRIVDVPDVIDGSFRRDWCALLERLMGMSDAAEPIRLVDAQLWRLFGRRGLSTSWVDGALHYLTHQPTDQTVAQLTGRLRVSQRQLTRRFSEEIGLPPKTFARVMRFRRLFQTVLTRPQRRWHDLIYEGGWYDQAHFIQDLRAFTGQTPSAFFAQYYATADFLLNN